MENFVFLAVLFAAACHAGWNALIKVGLDPLSKARIDILWKKLDAASFKDQVHEGKARRVGPAWHMLDDAPGVAIVTPLVDGSPFIAFGDASGFPTGDLDSHDCLFGNHSHSNG